MKLRRTAVSAAITAGIAMSCFATAGSANATPTRVLNCSWAGTDPFVELVHYGWDTQCFVNTSDGNNRLVVNDWYNEVRSTTNKVQVIWHIPGAPSSTDKSYTIGPGYPASSTQPGPGWILEWVTWQY